MWLCKSCLELANVLVFYFSLFSHFCFISNQDVVFCVVKHKTKFYKVFIGLHFFMAFMEGEELAHVSEDENIPIQDGGWRSKYFIHLDQN